MHLRAGETKRVTLYPAHTDFAPPDESGARAARSGEYRLSFGVPEAAAHGMGYAEAWLLAL